MKIKPTELKTIIIINEFFILRNIIDNNLKYYGLRARISVNVDIYNCTKRKRKKYA